MADYYTPTVVDPPIPLVAILPIERLFLAQVFTEEEGGTTAYYFSEEGASDFASLDSAKVRAALENASSDSGSLVRTLREALAQIDRTGQAAAGTKAGEVELDLCGDLWPEVLQDIVRRSPELDHLTVTMAFTCSKMRPDGFGGLAMLITAETIRSESTNTVFERFYAEAQAKGEISDGHS